MINDNNEINLSVCTYQNLVDYGSLAETQQFVKATDLQSCKIIVSVQVYRYPLQSLLVCDQGHPELGGESGMGKSKDVMM